MPVHNMTKHNPETATAHWIASHTEAFLAKASDKFLTRLALVFKLLKEFWWELCNAYYSWNVTLVLLSTNDLCKSWKLLLMYDNRHEWVHRYRHQHRYKHRLSTRRKVEHDRKCAQSCILTHTHQQTGTQNHIHKQAAEHNIHPVHMSATV